jgi:SAM-dependent methyltransferase
MKTSIRNKITFKHISKAIIRRWEKLNGIDFSTPINDIQSVGVDPTISSASEPVYSKFLKNVLVTLKINDQDKIIDIGCGKGNAMRVMLKFPFAKVDGIEISEIISEIARKNFKRLRNDKPQIYTMNAIEFKGYDDYNYIYLFNPFPSSIMLKVLKKLTTSIQRNHRKVTIIYVNPVCHDDIIKTNFFYKKVGYRYKTKSPIWIYTTDK